MVKTLKSRLVAYRANGSKLGLLPEPASYTVSFTHDAVGALTVSYSRKALRGEILDRRLETGLEIAVEVSDGGRWVEPYNGRHRLTFKERFGRVRHGVVDRHFLRLAVEEGSESGHVQIGDQRRRERHP